jgi:hypothetical protein
MLYARLYNLVDEFRLATLAQLNWEAPMGSDLCILFCLQNGNADKTRVDSSLLTAVARLFRGIDLQVGV